MEFDASHSWDPSKMTDETAMEMFLHFLTGDVYFFYSNSNPTHKSEILYIDSWCLMSSIILFNCFYDALSLYKVGTSFVILVEV